MRPNPPRPGVPLTLIIQRQRRQQREIERDWSRPRPELPLPHERWTDEQWIQPPDDLPSDGRWPEHRWR